ncbi:MAG: TonB-dependent receptor [Chitinophagaceae bacterium]
MYLIALAERTGSIVKKAARFIFSSSYKFLLVMKIMALLLFVACLHANADVVAQQVTLSERTAPLEKIFSQIEKQTGFSFLYSDEMLQKTVPVSITANRMQLADVLKEIFKDQPLAYTVFKKTIILEVKKSPPVVTPNLPAELRTLIKGVVTDVKGVPLAGATISVAGSGKYTQTNGKGEFTIEVADENAVLEVSMVGYKAIKKTVGKDSIVTIVLTEDTQGLDQVVVVGYGTQKKATLTGAISTVSGAEVLKSPNSNVTNSLVGRLTGLSAVQRSGQPGSNEALINIRGAATYNNSAAIVVVDGVERSGFGDIDPNEIETITVLKDAASTAVFGIKGANGVIVITTKAGKEGRPRISYSGNFSLQSYTGIPKAVDAYTNASLINEANRNDGLAETWTADELQKFKDGSDPLGYPNVNWFDYLTRKVYPQTQHNVNVSGGTKMVKYFASIGYLFEDGIFKKFESPYGFRTSPSYTRYNFRSNIDFTLSKNLTVGVKLGGRLQKRYQPSGLQSSSGSFSYDNVEAMISRVLQTPSFAFPVTLPDGRIAQNPGVGTNIWNPYAVITRWGTRNDDNNNMESTFNLNYKLDGITKGLSFKTVFGYDSYFSGTTRRNANWAAYVIDRKTKEVTLSSDRPRDEPLSGLITSYDGFISTNIQAGFNYDRSFGPHAVTALLLGVRQLLNDKGTDLNAPPKASQGIVSRITYNYDRRYFIEFNAAYNGSENFAPGKQYGFFPAVSAGWTLTNEKFMENVPWLNNLKIRGSYGLVGNDKLNVRFLFLDNYGVQTGGSTNIYSKPGNGVRFGLPTSAVTYDVVVQSSFGNPDVTWETGTKRNIGIESSLFNNTLTLNIDLFDERRKDILTNRSSGLLMYGQTYPALNIGEVYNKGYEIELNYKGKAGEISYSLGTQVSYARNKIINRDEPPGQPAYQKQEGKRVGQFFGYRTAGFYGSKDEITAWPANTLGPLVVPGDLKYIDYDQNNLIDANDRVPIGYSRTPEYIYSFSPTVSWRGLSLSVLFQGVANVSSDVILTEQNNGQQMYQFMTDRWTPQTAATAKWPALHSRGATFINYQLNDYILQDASYLKIRNAELSYNLPQRWLKPMNIAALRVYVSGQNLHTWTKFKMYLDPENINLSNTDFSKQSIYPTSRIYNLGVNVQF